MSRVSSTATPKPNPAAAQAPAASSASPAGASAVPPSVQAATGMHRAYEASLDFFLSPIKPFLDDVEVTEIMVNGHDAIYVEKAGQIERTTARFPCEADVQAAANNIAQFVGQPLSRERPLLDGRLPDGSRVCVVLAPIAVGGTQINIRRFARSTGSPAFLLEKKAITPMAMEFLLLAVKAYRNIIASGGAGSGKTTLVNILTNAFGEKERVVVIEDTRELQVQRPHVVQMEARRPDAYGRGEITVRDLFTTALRMRPDRIVVGEVRRGEALDMVQAMTSGHHGSLTTVHASSPADTCWRIETMALMADVGLPLYALRRQVASAIDLIAQTVRLASGRRLVSHISEVLLEEKSQNYVIHDIFKHEGDAATGQLVWTGRRPLMLDDLTFAGLAEEANLIKPMLEAKADQQ